MPVRYINEAEAFPLSACRGEANLEAFEEITLDLAPEIDAEILRIEETVSLGWRGVSSCSRQDRINAEARSALELWVKNKLFQYRDLDLIRYGSGEGRVRCSSGGGDWGSARWCSCGGSMPCYIEFKKK